MEQQVPSLNFKIQDEIERVGPSKIKVSLNFEAFNRTEFYTWHGSTENSGVFAYVISEFG